MPRPPTNREPPQPWRLTRRQLLRAGALVAAAAIGAGAVLAAVRTRGYAIEPGRRLVAMSAWQFVVAQQGARRIAAPARPGEPTIPPADAVDVAGFFDAWMARLPPRVRRD